MSNSNLTHISVILDRSGSMEAIRSDVVGGFNSFLKTQQEAPGECTLTLIQFDGENPYEILRDCVIVKDVKPLGSEYQPRANTPLYDAVGRGIADTGSKLEKMEEKDRPSKVVFVIITDGLENASKEYNSAKIAEMTKHQTEKYGWEFIYLGANQDAIAEGAKFGMVAGQAASYDARNFQGAIETSASKLRSYRSSGDKSDLNFTEEERTSIMGK